jgi:hypothetical protein
MVRSWVRCSLRLGLGLRLSTRGMALRIGRGGLVCGRATPMGVSAAVEVTPRRLWTLISTEFFQHPRIDVPTAEDGYVDLRLGEFIAVEQEASDRHGTTGLGDGCRI